MNLISTLIKTSVWPAQCAGYLVLFIYFELGYSYLLFMVK